MQYEYLVVEIVDTLGGEFVVKTIKIKIPIKEQKQNITNFLPNNAGILSIKECSADTIIDERIKYMDPMAGGF